MERRLILASFCLRIGLALVFLYAGIDAILQPENWVGYLPTMLRNIVPGTTLLLLFSIYEIILSLWLLSGKRSYEAALFSSITLFAILVTNLSVLAVVFRDIAIFAMSLALLAISPRSRS